MVIKEDEIRNAVNRTVLALKSSIVVDAVYLFGSYSTGKATDYSDIDLVFISEGFKGKDDYERSKLLMRVIDRIELPEPKDIEPVGLTNEEYEHPARFSLAFQIRKTGKQLFKRRGWAK